jgi:hypothetical protein
MISTCTRCATPLGSADRSCPACGTPAPRPSGVAPAGRRLILDDPPPAGPSPPPAPPVRRTAAAAGARAARRPRPGRGPVVVGTVTGAIGCDRRSAGGPGRRAAEAGAAVLAVVALLVLVILGGTRSAGAALVLLLVGGSSVLLCALSAGARRRRTGSRHPAPEPLTEERRFRVTETSGREVRCVLLGELHGAPLRRGDVVEVYGRTTRTGEVRVHEAVVVANRQVVRARPGPAFRLARAMTPLVVALGAACALGVVALLLVG